MCSRLREPDQGTSLCPLHLGGRRYEGKETVVDSGAEETVAPRGARTSARSRAGAYYRTARGAPAPRLGKLDVQFLATEGYLAEIPLHLADMERPLIAVTARQIGWNSMRNAARSRITLTWKTTI